MSLLAVEGLSLDLGGRPILRDLAFRIEAGEVFGLIGESGSGKSMTALALMGLAPRAARVRGRALFGGRDLIGLDDRAHRALRGAEIGMVFQEPMTALNPVQTIGAQVAETALIHGRGRADAAARARAALDRVGLAGIPFGRYPHELSGGQRQRVGIAMAVALRPKLLIADEPTTALDVATQAQVLDLLARLVAEDGMGLLLVTHDLAVAAGRADRLAVMREGRIVETGPAVEVLAAPRHPYTRALEAAARLPPRAGGAARAPGAALLEVAEAVREHRTPRPSLLAPRGRFRAVDGASLTVGRGETVALVGGSGCGKSTLARAALGLEPLQGGAVRLGGRPVIAPDVPRALRRRMQAVFQDPYGSFDPRWRVERLVAEPLHLLDAAPTARQRRARVEAALARVGLSAADADRFPHEFSGGQRQRLAIARALIVEPDVVVLDEATSALDVSTRAQILALFARLAEGGAVGYLFIAHDLSVVRAVADRTLVMEGGRIVEQGPTEALFAAPRHPCTQALLAASPDLDRALAARGAGPTKPRGAAAAASETGP
jgi:peptide/nickel transport system ATP-binding protein